MHTVLQYLYSGSVIYGPSAMATVLVIRVLCMHDLATVHEMRWVWGPEKVNSHSQRASQSR